MEHDGDARHRVAAGRMRRCASRAVELPRARNSMPIPSCGCGWMTAPLANSTVDAAITIQQRQAPQLRGRRREDGKCIGFMVRCKMCCEVGNDT